MNDSEQELRAKIGEVVAELGRQASLHPSSDLLLRYHRRELADDDAAKVRMHIATCRACAQQILDREAPVPPAESESHWTGPASKQYPLRIGLALTVILALGLGAQLLVLNQRLRESLGPTINTHRHLLEPIGVEVRSNSSGRVSVPNDSSPIFLELALGDSGVHGDYRVDVLREGSGGDLVWSSKGLLPSSYGTFSFQLPRRLLPPGSYRVELHGLGAPARRLAEYQFVVSDGGN